MTHNQALAGDIRVPNHNRGGCSGRPTELCVQDRKLHLEEQPERAKG